MRSFVAVNLPDTIKDEIGEIIDRLRNAGPKARWVPPQNLHITMKFLDEIGEEQVGPIMGAITLAKDAVEPFDLKLSGFGFFPNENRARVFWIGIEDGFEPLRAFARAIDKQVATLGFMREKRSFAAHITLARFRDPGPVGQLAKAAAHIQYESPPVHVTQVDLMKSVLSPKGAEYTIIDSVEL